MILDWFNGIFRMCGTFRQTFVLLKPVVMSYNHIINALQQCVFYIKAATSCRIRRATSHLPVITFWQCFDHKNLASKLCVSFEKQRNGGREFNHCCKLLDKGCADLRKILACDKRAEEEWRGIFDEVDTVILIIVKGKLRVAGVKLRLAGKRHRGILLSVQSSECLEFRVFIDYVTNCENLPSQESIVHQTYDLKKCECFKFKAITNGTQ